MVKLKMQDGRILKTEGDYEFNVDNVHYNPETNDTTMLISFYHSPEKPADKSMDECIEVLAEKLKQDFIVFNNQFKNK